MVISPIRKLFIFLSYLNRLSSDIKIRVGRNIGDIQENYFPYSEMVNGPKMLKLDILGNILAKKLFGFIFKLLNNVCELFDGSHYLFCNFDS